MARLTRFFPACWRSFATLALIAAASAAGVSPADAQRSRAAALPPGAIAMRTMLANISARDYRQVGDPFLEMEQRVLGLGTESDIRALAESGNVRAQYLYGRVLEYGQLGVTADLPSAIAWYRRSAARGDPHAQVALGYLYDRGNGVAQNYPEAARLYAAAAAQGHARGQYNLGVFYRDGFGVRQNPARAMALFRQAADQNYANASGSIAHLYEIGAGVRQDYAQAAGWARTGANLGSAQSQRRYGIYLYEGLGVARNQAEGLAWIRRAANAGDDFAQSYLRERNLSRQ
jgi:TPR repeat protein